MFVTFFNRYDSILNLRHLFHINYSLLLGQEAPISVFCGWELNLDLLYNNKRLNFFLIKIKAMWQFTISHAHIFHPLINCRDCFNIISKGYGLLNIKLIHDVVVVVL